MICLIPIGKVNKKILSFLKEELEKEFGESIEIQNPLAEPDYAYNLSRDQYNAPVILREIEIQRPGLCKRTLGLSNVDLYTEGLNFVFGQASPLTGVALISLTRLRQEYYGLPKDEILFKERTKKEAIHELGHTYGLEHCPNSKCVMYFSNSLLDTDRKQAFFCTQCKSLLKLDFG